MILINLLPHRERRRSERRRAFFMGVGLAAMIGAGLALFWFAVLQQMTSTQRERNEFLTAEMVKLDKQIALIATLREEIIALKARKQAVEDLQTDRNVPVYLLNEINRQTPQGVYLIALRQTGNSVLIEGHSQTNERISEFMRNTSTRSPWLERPELIESRAVMAPGQARGQERRLYAFSMRLTIKRPADAAAGASVPASAGNVSANAKQV